MYIFNVYINTKYICNIYSIYSNISHRYNINIIYITCMYIII